MCWTCNINKLKAQIAKEDINVYKIVKKATKKYCISPFMDYTYYSKDIQPSLTLGVMIEPCSIFAKITEGYHSYSSVNFVCDPSEYKYFIVYNSNIYKVDYNWTSIYDRIYFKNKKDAQAVIDNPNFRDILDAIYKN